MKKALITGSHGFVGPYLKKELEQNGYIVYGVDHQKVEENNYYYADITDKDQVKKVIEAIKPEYIFHLAGISSPAFAEDKPDLAYQVNVEGTKNLLSFLEICHGARVLIVSSSHVYGEPEQIPIKEGHPLNGNNAYADSKIKQEEAVKDYFNRMSIVIVRSFNHTGPMQPDNFVIPKIIRQIAEIKKGKRKILELDSVDVKRDISDVRDVVRAYRLLLEQNKFGIICNVCRGKSIGLKEVVLYGEKMAGLKEIKLRVNSEFVNRNNAQDIYGDNSYLKSLIDWKPMISYKDMIHDMLSYWDKQV